MVRNFAIMTFGFLIFTCLHSSLWPTNVLAIASCERMLAYSAARII